MISTITKKKVLIIGGTGVTGQLIIRDLNKYLLDHISITTASRHPLNNLVKLKGIDSIYLDIQDQEKAIESISKYDFVIIATGPFKKYGVLPYLLCIKARVNCLDINDDYFVVQEIYQLHKKAQNAQIKIYTGMGLNPGLMTYQIMKSVQNLSPDSAKDIAMYLFIGGKQESGYAAVEVMLEGFEKYVPCIRNGQIHAVIADDNSSADHLCDFSTDLLSLKTFYCPTTQVFSFIHNKTSELYNIQNLDFHIRFQNLDKKGVQFLRTNKWIKSRLIKNILKKLIFKSQKKRWNKPENIEESISYLVCRPAKDPIITSVWKGLSSYEMTARFASIMTELLITESNDNFGVFSFEQLKINQQLLDAKLKQREFNII